MPYNNVIRYVSPYTAIRSALGKIGYVDAMQTMQPDLIEWSVEAQDMISRLRTFTDLNCEPIQVCNNKIMLPIEMQLINCASANGVPMTFLNLPGCCDRLTPKSINRCCNSPQGFYLDECYMHFKPVLNDGVWIKIDGLKRPIGEDGYPLIVDVCVQAVSEYIASMMCARFRDNRFDLWDRKWKRHCVQARAELNRLGQQQIQDLGFLYHSVPVRASFGYAWGYGNVNGNVI